MAGLALTASNLQHLLEGEDQAKLEHLADILLLPKCEQQRISEDESLINAGDRLNAVFQYALETHPYASWRLIIRALDYLELYQSADTIRHYAEQVKEPTLTVENVFEVLKLTEQDWNGDIGITLLVPKGVREKITNEHSDVNAQKRALTQYWVETVYSASWNTLAGVLYYTQEQKALEKCKEFLQNGEDTKPPLDALKESFKEVTDWNGVGRCLRIPRSIRNAIKKSEEYKTDEERKAALLEAYYSNHPSPNWEEVGWALYMMSGENYPNPEDVKAHGPLKKLYKEQIIKAPDSENQRLMSSFQRAIEVKGSLKQTVMQAILHGNAGFGKTSLIKALLGMKSDTNEGSTGVMEEPKRIELSTVLVEAQGTTSNLKWTHIEDLQEEAALIVREVTSAQIPSSRSEKPEDEDDDEDLFEFTSLYPRRYTQLGNDKKYTTVQQESRASVEQRKALISEHPSQHIDKIREALETAKTKMQNLNQNPWTLYISDIGGQLEFQELIPALTNGPSLHFIVIAANQDLNKECRVVYHKQSDSTEPYYSSHTLKENVLQQLSTIMSTGRNDQSPKIILFLTFKDQISEKKLKEIDYELKELIETTAAFKRGAIEPAEDDGGWFCHPIDNTDPDETDVHRIRKTVERIGNRITAPYRVETPYTWLYFSIALRAMNKQVLSYDNCVKIGRECGVEDIHDALIFLHYNIGMIRYFGAVEELKNIVVIEPRIIFKNVTRLVEETFTFNSVNKAELDSFRKKGIFTAAMVANIKTGSKILTRQKLLAFLNYHHILAPLGNGKHFLPCSLVHGSVHKPTEIASSPLPSLCVTFDTGYLPRGLFGYMVADLITNGSLELKEDKIYRDQVTFSIEPYNDEFRLSAYPSYIRIDVYSYIQEQIDRVVSLDEI